VKFELIDREQFIRTPKSIEDRFASTFKAKADAMKLWPFVYGWVQKEQVLAAICVRVTTRAPIVANLQLLHTFAANRRKGLARALVLREYQRIYNEATYFRVSSEHDAVEFYRSLGLKFWGKQKSGSYLCIHKIADEDPAHGRYALVDNSDIEKLLHSGRRGSLVEEFDFPQ
jgi:hypothetical protein